MNNIQISEKINTVSQFLLFDQRRKNVLTGLISRWRNVPKTEARRRFDLEYQFSMLYEYGAYDGKDAKELYERDLSLEKLARDD
jgi:hypothetical protein